ncbi:hypothetical protein M3Y99_01411900 [Aphelenchoides fujianensis]|nr:hypothetical protein M3Y99_01411900 [Aphelenchoides fujianensis]
MQFLLVSRAHFHVFFGRQLEVVCEELPSTASSLPAGEAMGALLRLSSVRELELVVRCVKPPLARQMFEAINEAVSSTNKSSNQSTRCLQAKRRHRRSRHRQHGSMRFRVSPRAMRAARADPSKCQNLATNCKSYGSMCTTQEFTDIFKQYCKCTGAKVEFTARCLPTTCKKTEKQKSKQCAAFCKKFPAKCGGKPDDKKQTEEDGKKAAEECKDPKKETTEKCLPTTCKVPEKQKLPACEKFCKATPEKCKEEKPKTPEEKKPEPNKEEKAGEGKPKTPRRAEEGGGSEKEGGG